MGNVLSVKATARTVCKPDFACITLFVRSEGLLMSDAVKNAEERTARAVKMLRDQFPGVRDVMVSTFKLGEKDRRYTDDRGAAPRPEVIRLLLVRVPVDGAMIVSILDAAVRSDLLIQSPNAGGRLEPSASVVYVSAGKGAGRQPLLAAIDAAREKAGEIAAHLGRKLGPVVGVPASDVYSPLSNDYRRSELERLVGERFYSIDAEGVEICAAVTVEFGLDVPSGD